MTDLKEAKRLIAYAKRMGAKALTWGDLHIEFREGSATPSRQRGADPASVKGSEGKTTLTPDPAPTLDQINQYIYGDPDGAPSDPHEPH